MKKNLILFLSILLGCTPFSKQDIAVSTVDLEQAKFAFAEVTRILESDNGFLWNHKLDGGILLINRNTRVIIANEPDKKGVLKKQGDLYVGLFPENMVVAHSAIDWNGKRWATYSFPLPGSQEDWTNGLVHELFHRIQPEIGFDNLKESQNEHLDTKKGRIFLKLEIEALRKALQSDKPLDHIKNALLFRQYRCQQFPEAKVQENSLEINEGIAQYTNSVLIPRSTEEQKEYYESQIDIFHGLSTYVRSFAYFTIPVYGYFMKQSEERWNLRINSQTNLTDFMVSFFQVDIKTISKEEIMELGKSYGIDIISDSEDLREQKRIEQVKKFKSIFLSDSVLVIPILNATFGFGATSLVPLDSLGTVYPVIVVSDTWGMLKVDSLGALMSGDYEKITLSFPNQITDTLVQGNGWRLNLNKSWALQNDGIKYILVKK